MTTDEMIMRADAGEPIKNIAVLAGVRFDTVYKKLRQANYKVSGLWQPTVNLPEDAGVLAYIAGIVDADGSIMNTCRGWTVQVGMTDEPTIEWLHQWGGTVSSYQPKGNRKHVWTWTVNRRRDVITMVQAILPYLITKHNNGVQCLEELGNSATIKLSNSAVSQELNNG